MLLLTRKPEERVVIDGGVTVEVLDVRGQRVLLGFTAPEGVRILREELLVDEGEPEGVVA